MVKVRDCQLPEVILLLLVAVVEYQSIVLCSVNEELRTWVRRTAEAISFRRRKFGSKNMGHIICAMYVPIYHFN